MGVFVKKDGWAMRYFPIPLQITHEEKQIGGKLSFRQACEMIAGIAFGAVMDAAFWKIFYGKIPLMALAATMIPLFAAPVVTAAFAAFREVPEVDGYFDQYLYLKIKYRLMTRKFIHYP